MSKENEQNEPDKNEPTELKVDEAKILNAIEELKNKGEKDSISLEEAKALISKGIQKGATIAKDQLNKTIENLKTTVKDLKADKTATEKKITDLEAKINSSKPAENTDELAKVKTELEGELKKTKDKLDLMENKAVDAVQRVQTLENDVKAKELENYRLQKVSENAGKLIPDLVKGATKEEIDASIEVAKARYNEIVESVKKGAKLPTEKEEKKEEEKKETEVKRINVSDKVDISTYKAERKKIADAIYKEAGFNV